VDARLAMPAIEGRHVADAAALLLQAGVEMIPGPDSLLGASARGGSVHVGWYHGQPVAVKLCAASDCVLAPPSSEVPAHESVVRCLSWHANESQIVEVRELCDGGELYDRIAEEGPLSPQTALAYFTQAASAIAHCHFHGLIHGQLRPEHVMVGANDQAVLLGFRSPPPSTGNQPPTVCLRPVQPLDAPELRALHGVAGEVEISQLAKADVWSLGVLLLAMLTGTRPFASSVASECPRFSRFLSGGLWALLAEEITLVPEQVRPLLTAMLRPEASARPTASEVLSCLGAAPSVFCSPEMNVAPTDLPLWPASQRLAADNWRASGPVPMELSSTASAAAPAAPVAAAGTPSFEAAVPVAAVPTAGVPMQGHNKKAQRLSTELMPPPTHSSAGCLCRSATSGGDGGSAVGMGDRDDDTSAPLRTPGHVRSLGWVGLPNPVEQLLSAVQAALASLAAPYEHRSSRFIYVVTPPPSSAAPDTPQSAPDSLLSTPTIELSTLSTPTIDTPTMDTSLMGAKEAAMGEHRLIQPQPLIVFVQVLKENESSPRHDISVRRVQGTSWSFQAFYSNFREEISRQLGMSDYTQLSLYSPMVQKRKPLNQRASSWFSSCRTDADSHTKSIKDGVDVSPSVSSTAFNGSQRSHFGAREEAASAGIPPSVSTADGDGPRFKRSKNKVGGPISLPMPSTTRPSAQPTGDEAPSHTSWLPPPSNGSKG